MKFGPYLRRLREAANVTQRNLAHKCGLSDAYVNQLETEMADPPTHQVCTALARALDADASELWKNAFEARLKAWLKKEGFRKIPKDATSAFFESLNSRK